MLCLGCTDLGATVVVTKVVDLVQTLAPHAMRERLQSLLLMISFGFQPIAALVLGSSATWFGAQRTVHFILRTRESVHLPGRLNNRESVIKVHKK